MKKIILFAAVAALTLSSCTAPGALTGNNAGLISALTGGNQQQSATTGNTGSALAQIGSGVVGSILGNLLGATTLNEQAIVGTWNYQGVDCVFESENILAQMGGELAANTLEGKIDTQLQKIGVKPGSCSFTFNPDHTYTATLAGKTLSGQWALDAANKQMQLTYLMGLGQLTPRVAYTGGKLSLLFESTKLLTLVKGVGALTNNTTAQALSGLITNYNGMYLGLQMTK